MTLFSQTLALLKGKSRLSEIELETAETGYAPVQVYDDHGLQAYGKKAEDYGSYGHGDKGRTTVLNMYQHTIYSKG